jgi:hypothetical protein
MDSGKTIDDDFIRKSIEIFHKVNPDAKDNLEILIYSAILFSHIKDHNVLVDAAAASGLLIGELEIKSLEYKSKDRHSIKPYVFVIRNNDVCPGALDGKDYLNLKKGKDGRVTIIIRTDDNGKIRKAFEYIKKHPIIRSDIMASL